LPSISFEDIVNQKSYVNKAVFMIKKVLSEIIQAKGRREVDGIYSA
tara:strand:+ start:310 stop:447 length:138 start_codon:yes stop_codon:yes gene_type:complete